MFTQFRRGKTLFSTSALAAVALGGFLLFAGATSAQAHDRDECYRRINKAEWKLDKAIEHHGYYSRQADRRRYELRQARERCRRERHEWWDGRENRWRRDWDRD